MEMLHEIISTKYIIDKLNRRFRNTLDTLIGKEVDLAYCRFGPESAEILTEYYDKIIFRNSENKELDELLQFNRNLVLNPEIDWPVLDFDNVVHKETWFEDIPKIPSGKYLIKINKDDIVQECLLILTIMIRPDIHMDLSNCMADIMGIVSRKIDIADFDEDEVYIVKTPYLYLAKKSDVTRLNGTVVPASFGRDKMLALDDSKPKLHRGYKYLVEWIDEVVTESMTPKVKEQVDITKYLQIRD